MPDDETEEVPIQLALTETIRDLTQLKSRFTGTDDNNIRAMLRYEINELVGVVDQLSGTIKSLKEQDVDTSTITVEREK